MEHSNQSSETEHGAGGRTRSDIAYLRRLAGEQGGEMWARLNDWIQERPLPALAAAFAVGYVVSGGLLSRPTLRLARLGARTYLRHFLGDFLSQSASQLLTGLMGADVTRQED